MNSTKGEAPTVAPDEASVSNQTSNGKTDMDDFTATAIETATKLKLTVFAPELTNENGQITTTSIQVAQHFCKRHDTVLRAIRNLGCSAEFRLRNFAACSRPGSNNKPEPYFKMTRDGFTFLAMGFTGKEADQWKEAYIMAFNKMEAELVSKQGAEPRIPYAVAPGQTISAAQADMLRDLLASFAANMPADMRDQILREGRSKLKSHFKTDYRHIPAAQFTEAISIISRHAVEWGPRAPSQKALAPVSTTALQLILVTTCNGQPTVEMLPASELPQLILSQDSPFTTAEVLEIAQHANMRMTNEVGRLARNSEAARMKEAVLAMGAGDLAEIAKSAWLELAYRTTTTNGLATA